MQIRKYMSWPVCLLFVAGLALGSPGSVLCVGDDDHVKIESVCQPCCGDSETACNLTLSGSKHDHHDDCADCTDLSLTQGFLSQRPFTKTNYDGTIHLSYFAALTTVVNCQLTATAATSPEHGLELPSKEALLSSTVLRC